MISRWKIHPFLSIMAVAFALGIIGGIPLVKSTGAEGEAPVKGIADVIGEGFSGIFTSIGIVIILGTLIGLILERTGGAFRIADALVRVVGKRYPVLAMQLMGWVVSIPVFCDSGFVILNPIRKALARRTGASPVAMTVALAAGLYTSHVFIPPTPGPIAAAQNLGIGDHLLLVIGLGVLVSIPALLVAYLYALYIGKRVSSPEETGTEDADELEAAYDALRRSYGRMPGTAASFAPIIAPHPAHGSRLARIRPEVDRPRGRLRPIPRHADDRPRRRHPLRSRRAVQRAPW
ncbi:SLC13 family permease [Micrococcus sp. XM4230B]|nr:SLC13 family permease [Micrococcus sp. XM4230B]